MKIHSRYDLPPSPSVTFDDVSLTRQDMAQECDINYIVARAGAGLIAPLRCPEPVYTDLTQVPADLESCLRIQIDAQARFDRMPSRVRERFGNDPARLIAFLNDSKNLDAAIELGLIPKPVVKVESVNSVVSDKQPVVSDKQPVVSDKQ